MTENKVTGKKLLEDCAILARDLGVFVVDVSKRAYAAIKNALADKKDKADAPDAKDIKSDAVDVAVKPTAAVG